MTEFLERLGDRVNPIVVKETRQAVSSRLVATFLLLFLTVQIVVMLITIADSEASNPGDLDLRAGRDVFTAVQGVLLGTCLVLIPTMTSVRLASERSDGNTDLLFISSLTPRAVLTGKLVAAGALALLIFSACAPFMTFAYVMRGLDVPTIFVILVADFLTVLLATAFGLFLAAVPANRGFRIVLGLGGAIGMCYLGAGLLALSTAFLHGEADLETTSWEFWAGFAGAAALVFGTIGQLFVWSVALISPPSSNRMFPVRAYALGLWGAEALGFGAWSLYLARPEPMVIWGVLGCALFSLHMLIAVSERDAWGTRVAARIPRRAVLRVPAFLLYSGAAGGIAFGAIGSALTALGLVAWYRLVPPPYVHDEKAALAVALVTAYTYCYCLTAVLVRRAIGAAALRPGHTWIVAGFLFGLGSTVPYLIRFALLEPASRHSDMHEPLVLFLASPVVMTADALRTGDTHIVLTVFFLAAWGAAVTMANAQWLARQVGSFRPPESGTGARGEPIGGSPSGTGADE